MPKSIFTKLNFTHITPMPMMLQLADSTVNYPAVITEDILVKIQGYFVPVDFVVLDMETTKESPLILGRPFLNTIGAQIDVGAREIHFNINGKEEKFDFWPRQEQCSMIRIKYGPNPQGIKEVQIQPQLVAGLTKKNKENKKRRSQKRTTRRKRKKNQRLFPHYPRRKRCGNKKEEALKSTTTPPKSNKMVWRPKKVQPSVPTPPGIDIPSSSKKCRGRKSCSLDYKR
jgi:hypothetical protein